MPNSLVTGVLILAVVYAGAMTGMRIGRLIPQTHLNAETKSVISVSMAVVGTMTALVIGLLISSASNSYSVRNSEITSASADLIRLDKILRHYGADADPARDALRQYSAMKSEDLFPRKAGQPVRLDNPVTMATLAMVEERMLVLKPEDDRRRWLLNQALQLGAAISQTRWLLLEQKGATIPVPFLLLVVAWLTLLFASFGLFAPRNITVMASLFLCAVAVSGGLVMVLEMEKPFNGVVHISGAAMRHAAEVIAE